MNTSIFWPENPFSLKSTSFALVLMISGLHPAVHATNGYSPTGFGTSNKGMAGAGVALPQDTLAAATNPAGMALIGHRWDTGVALFSPSDRGYTADTNGASITPGEYTSENDLFLIPHFGWNKPLSDSSSIGVSVGGNGGMNTEYDTAVFGNFGAATAPTGVDFAQIFVGVTYAQEVSEKQWIGVMPIIAIQRFKAEGLEPFNGFSIAPGKVTNNGADISKGYGVRVGWLSQVNEQLSLGVSYQSRLEMSKLDKYAGLFAEQGDFDTPSTWVVGFVYKLAPEIRVLLDFQRINYGKVKSLANTNDVNIFADPNGLLGADGGLGFGWKDMDIYKLGAQWDYDQKLTLRAGYSHASKLFDSGQALFNILAPATIRNHVSVGGSYQYTLNNEINFSLTKALKETVAGSNPIFTGPQTGSVQMEQLEFEVSWGHRF